MSVERSLDYLASAACFDSLRKDPYWPKWDSPWWHMVLLWELGKAPLIPKAAAQALAESMDRRWSRVWLAQEGLPEGFDRHTGYGCFCAIGIIEQVLRAAGVELRALAPWIPDWPLKYVLPDGGVNCDEEVYLPGGSRRSSYQSTIAVAEAVLSRPELSERETAFVDGAARYLIARRLFFTSAGEVVDLGWLQPKFPRFYDYDVLRGLRYLARWKKRLGREVPKQAVADALERLPQDGRVASEPADCLSRPDLGGKPASWFPLLTEAAKPGFNPILTEELNKSLALI